LESPPAAFRIEGVMEARWTAGERRLLERLDEALRADDARAVIAAIAERVEGILARDPDAIEAWEPVPLETYGRELPAEIRSSWVFILRAGTASGAERHPNSVQRMATWSGGGDFRVHDGRRWKSHRLKTDPDAKLEERWLSIPPMTWHQGVVGAENWVVVSFHTVPAAELIEERPSPSDADRTDRRRYLEVRQA
jgi:hypothetical protein